MTTLVAGMCCSLLFASGGLFVQGYCVTGLSGAAVGSITLAILFGLAKRP